MYSVLEGSGARTRPPRLLLLAVAPLYLLGKVRTLVT